MELIDIRHGLHLKVGGSWALLNGGDQFLLKLLNFINQLHVVLLVLLILIIKVRIFLLCKVVIMVARLLVGFAIRGVTTSQMVNGWLISVLLWHGFVVMLITLGTDYSSLSFMVMWTVLSYYRASTFNSLNVHRIADDFISHNPILFFLVQLRLLRCLLQVWIVLTHLTLTPLQVRSWLVLTNERYSLLLVRTFARRAHDDTHWPWRLYTTNFSLWSVIDQLCLINSFGSTVPSSTISGCLLLHAHPLQLLSLVAQVGDVVLEVDTHERDFRAGLSLVFHETLLGDHLLDLLGLVGLFIEPVFHYWPMCKGHVYTLTEILTNFDKVLCSDLQISSLLEVLPILGHLDPTWSYPTNKTPLYNAWCLLYNWWLHWCKGTFLWQILFFRHNRYGWGSNQVTLKESRFQSIRVDYT